MASLQTQSGMGICQVTLNGFAPAWIRHGDLCAHTGWLYSRLSLARGFGWLWAAWGLAKSHCVALLLPQSGMKICLVTLGGSTPDCKTWGFSGSHWVALPQVWGIFQIKLGDFLLIAKSDHIGWLSPSFISLHSCCWLYPRLSLVRIFATSEGVTLFSA